MKTFTLKLPAPVYSWLVEESRQTGRSKSQLVREALEHSRKRKKTPTALDLAADLCGMVESGLRDLSTNKKHLKGFGR